MSVAVSITDPDSECGNVTGSQPCTTYAICQWLSRRVYSSVRQ